METFGQTIKLKRENKGLLLRQVAAYLDIDQAILCKIENGKRKACKTNILKLAEILECDKDNLMVHFLSENIAFEIANEDCASKALKAAEKKIKFIKSQIER